MAGGFLKSSMNTHCQSFFYNKKNTKKKIKHLSHSKFLEKNTNIMGEGKVIPPKKRIGLHMHFFTHTKAKEAQKAQELQKERLMVSCFPLLDKCITAHSINTHPLAHLTSSLGVGSMLRL